MPTNDEQFLSPCADGTVKLARRDQVFRTSAVNQDQPAQGEEHGGVLQKEADGSQPSGEQTDDICPR